jgi:WD40 repeat protein
MYVVQRWPPFLLFIVSFINADEHHNHVAPVKRYRLAGDKRLSQQGFVYTCAPAPSGSSFTCAVGTSLGLLQLRPEDGLSWLTAAPPMAGEIQSSSGKAGQERRYDEIFAIDFLSSNPDVILYGGRDPRVRVLDPRTAGPSMRHGSSLYINHTSSTCHIKAVGEHRFLVAGPRSAMCVYDLRFLRDTDAESGRYRNIKNGTQPVVRFPDYKNEAYIDSGLDVLRGPEHGPGDGVVAAAHDDGKVALFSLRYGTRLKSPVVDQIDYQARRSDAGKRVVRSLAFSTLPGERLASLFVGGYSEVRKYSFQRGGQNGDDW